MFEIVGLGIALGACALLLWRIVKNHGVAIETLDEMANGLSSLHTATLMQSELAFAQRERLIEAIAAIPVRPSLATVGPGVTRETAPVASKPSPTPVRTPTSAPGPITTLPLRIPVPTPAGSAEVSAPASPKPIKKVEDEDGPRAHHCGPPSPSPKAWERFEKDWPQDAPSWPVTPSAQAFPKPLKKVDEDWPQHD